MPSAIIVAIRGGRAILERGLRSPGATSPRISSSAAGRVLCVFTREWLDADVAVVDGVDRRARLVRGPRDARRLGALPRAGLRRPAPARRVVEAPDRRVRAPRPAARDDGDRRRPARDRERPRHRRRPLALRRGRRAPARRLLHGVVVRARLAASSRRAARSRRATSRGCCGARHVLGLAEMMNFPGVVVGRRRRAREARPGASTSTAMRPA